MEAINCIIKEAEGECRAKRKDFLSGHVLRDFRKYLELFRKKETGESGDEDSALNLSSLPREVQTILPSCPCGEFVEFSGEISRDKQTYPLQRVHQFASKNLFGNKFERLFR